MIKVKTKENNSRKLTRHYKILIELKIKYILDETNKVFKESLHYSRHKRSAILGKVHCIADLAIEEDTKYVRTLKKIIARNERASKVDLTTEVQEIIKPVEVKF